LSGTLPYIFTHDLYRMAGSCILISHEMPQNLLQRSSHSLPRSRSKIN
jgi:hypothetical protein